MRRNADSRRGGSARLSRMKLFVKVLCFGLVLALAGPFVMRGPDGQPLYTPAQAWRSLQSSMPALDVPDVMPSKPVAVYRWQDAEGQWHFSGQPPAEGTPFTVLEIDPKTNAVGTAPEPAPEAAVADTAAPAEGDAPKLGPEDAMLGPYPNPEAVRQLIQDARALQAQSLERIEALENTP